MSRARQTFLLQVFSSWGIFSFKMYLFELGKVESMSGFLAKKGQSKFFVLALIPSNFGLSCVMICSLCPQQLALLPAVICPVTAGCAFDEKLGL